MSSIGPISYENRVPAANRPPNSVFFCSKDYSYGFAYSELLSWKLNEHKDVAQYIVVIIDGNDCRKTYFLPPEDTDAFKAWLRYWIIG